jgi:hypothetical protein
MSGWSEALKLLENEMQIKKFNFKCSLGVLITVISFTCHAEEISRGGVVEGWCHEENELPSSTPISQFSIFDNGTVVDDSTQLMWTRCAAGQSGADCEVGSGVRLNWQDALSTSESSTFAGYDDWRLPNIKELASLVEYRCRFPAINSALFPNLASHPNPNATHQLISPIWSSTPSLFAAQNNTKEGDTWYLEFSRGTQYIKQRTELNYVLMVRSR